MDETMNETKSPHLSDLIQPCFTKKQELIVSGNAFVTMKHRMNVTLKGYRLTNVGKDYFNCGVDTVMMISFTEGLVTIANKGNVIKRPVKSWFSLDETLFEFIFGQLVKKAYSGQSISLKHGTMFDGWYGIGDLRKEISWYLDLQNLCLRAHNFHPTTVTKNGLLRYHETEPFLSIPFILDGLEIPSDPVIRSKLGYRSQ